MSRPSCQNVILVGHDNYGSREIFTQIVNANSDVTFHLFISTGLYYRRSFIGSVFKLIKEASFIFCLIRFLEGLLYKFKGDTLESRAKHRGINITFITDVNSDETHKIIKNINPELMVSMFTMQIFQRKTIDLPRLGTIGTHPSILPQYRGLEVFFWMLANEETEGGVSVFYLDPKIDAGKVFLQKPFDIYPDESVDSIYKKLTVIAADLLGKAVGLVLAEKQLSYVQPQGKSSYYPMPTRASFRKFMKTNHTWFRQPKKEFVYDSLG